MLGSGDGRRDPSALPEGRHHDAATTRVMRSHGLQAGKAIPDDKTVNVWRCPACGRELPRSS